MPPHRPPSCGGGAAQRCAVCDGGAEPRGSRFVSFHFSLGKFLIPPPAAVPAVPPPLGAPPRPHSASAERSAERQPLRAVGAVLCPLLCAATAAGDAARLPPPHPHPLLGPGAAVQCWMSHTAPIPHHCIPPIPSPPRSLCGFWAPPLRPNGSVLPTSAVSDVQMSSNKMRVFWFGFFSLSIPSPGIHCLGGGGFGPGAAPGVSAPHRAGLCCQRRPSVPPAGLCGCEAPHGALGRGRISPLLMGSSGAALTPPCRNAARGAEGAGPKGGARR